MKLKDIVYDDISFDDFVMFARSSIALASYLFDSIMYDYTKIISTVPQSTLSKWKTFNQKRRERAIYLYIKSSFKTDEHLEAELQNLANEIMAQ